MVEITLPYNWEPRPYQKPFWDAMMRGCRRAMLIWHRRAGKDLTALNWAIFDMCVLHQGGAWWHVWPSYAQGRKFWEGADNQGRRMIDYFPPPLIKRKREDMMMLELHNGSIYRVVGSDDPDALVGANPIGLIMTEYALQNPQAWDYLRPILKANNGTAVFPMTPRGHNHAYNLYAKARKNPNWFTSLQTIEDTKALPMSMLNDERAEGMSEELIQQEYYCSFSAPLSGAYYSVLMANLEKNKQITHVPYDPHLPVDTWWDLGNNDYNAIWFVQRHRAEIRAIDYLQGVHENGMLGWIKQVKEKPYVYGRHVAPHDIVVREYTTGKSRWQTAKDYGIVFDVAPKGVNPTQQAEHRDQVKRALPNCWFDADKCYEGIEALKAFRREYDEKRGLYLDRYAHDWASHAAKAFEHGIVGSRGDFSFSKPRKRKEQPYDPFAASRPFCA